MRKCEICKKNCDNIINISLDVGYHFEDTANNECFLTIPSKLMSISSFVICPICQSKIMKNKFFSYNSQIVMEELKKSIIKNWDNNIMLEELKDEMDKENGN